ncbi:hypothetical protein FACS1894181_16600 [Bacteroidia bacterium]|nr:hypothetical protein FACS1894181_16600 [Bacteroidia bacterium]
MDIIDIKTSSDLEHLHNGEHYSFSQGIVEGIEADMAEVADAMPSFNIYKAHADYESILFKLSAESKETAMIATKNKQRIACWRLIMRLLDYYADNNPEPDLQEPAQRLRFVLKTYKSLTGLNLFAKTGYIFEAINALKEPSEQTALNAIPGLLCLANQLENVNNTLDGLYIKREQDKGLVRGLGTLSEYRSQVDKALSDLIGDLNSAYRRNELGAKNAVLKASIEKAANTINSLFAKIHNILVHRSARSKKKKNQKPDNTLLEGPDFHEEG